MACSLPAISRGSPLKSSSLVFKTSESAAFLQIAQHLENKRNSALPGGSFKMRKFRNYFLIGLLAFVLRALFLGRKSLWMDEGFSVWMASHTLPELFKLIPHDAHPFIFYTFLHFWMKGGDSEAYLRFPSVICGVISCLVIYALGKELLGEKQGILTAVFWACAMIALNSETDVRMYAYATCFALLSTFWFWRAYQYGGKKNWALYYVFASLSLYTHYYTGFIIMAQWIFLLVEKRWREAVWVPLILTLIFSPWTPVFFFQFFHAIDTRMPKAGWFETFLYFGMFLNARRYFTANHLFITLASIFSIGALLWGFFKMFKKNRKEAIFLMLLFGIPFSVPFAISHFSPRHIFVFRYTVLFAPYFFLLFLYGLFNIPRTAAFPVYGALIFMNVSIWILSLTGPAYQTQNWREAARKIENHLRKTQVILVEQQMSIYPLWYYLSQRFPIVWNGNAGYDLMITKKRFIPVVPLFGTSLPGVKQWINHDEKEKSEIWLVLCQPFLVDKHLAVPKWLLSHQKILHIYELRSISKINRIVLYLLAPPLLSVERSRIKEQGGH